MEISNSIKFNYKYQSIQTREISAGGGIQACEAHGVSLPSISPAYYSPSFTATIRKKRPFLIEYPAWTYNANMLIRYSQDREISNARDDKLYEWVYFLEGENKYSDDERDFILTSVCKDCTDENYAVPPKPDKEALDVTMYRYNVSKEDGSSDEFYFGKEYKKELKLKDWRKSLLSDDVKYSPRDCIQIIRALIENNEPEDIPPFDSAVFDITMRQKEKNNSALTVSERENFDFNKEYKSNLKKFGCEDDGVFGFEGDETKYLREKYLRKDMDDYSGHALSTYELKRLLENECNVKFPAKSFYLTKALETPIVGEDISEEGASEVNVKAINDLAILKSKKTVFNNRADSVTLYKLMSCGNNNYAGFIDGLSDEELIEAGFKTKIDLTGKLGDKNLSISDKDGLTIINFDINGYGDMYDIIWSNPAFLTKEVYELFLKSNQEKYAKYLSPEDNKKNREEIKEKVDNYDSTCREFIDDFTTVIHYLNDGYCYYGCNHGNKITNNMVLLDYFFNPKSKEPSSFESLIDISGTSSMQLYKHFGLIAASMKNLYDKLTPEDKNKMGWDEEFDKNFVPRLYKNVSSLGQEEIENYKWATM